MKARHGYRYVSVIPKEKADLLREEWSDYAVSSANPKDRAQNITYDFPEVCKITMSHSNGSITIFTDCKVSEIESFMRKWLNDVSMAVFKDNLRCREFGVHFSKFHGTMPFLIKYSGQEIPGWISARVCKDYGDVHFRIKVGDTDITFPSNKKMPNNASSSPKKHYHSDMEIVEFVKKKGSVGTGDGVELGLCRSAFYRRLEKITTPWSKIKKDSIYPAIYSYED